MTDQGRLLRECAVDLIRASDLYEGEHAARESAHARVLSVLRELERVEAAFRKRSKQKCSSAVWRAKSGAPGLESLGDSPTVGAVGRPTQFPVSGENKRRAA